jgi:hypothetical protein
MCMASTTLGNDKSGMEFLAESAAMAERLQLYNIQAHVLPHVLSIQDRDIAAATAATAWGSFNFQM